MSDRKRNRLAKLSDEQLRVLYDIHLRDEVSAGDLAEIVAPQMGFLNVIAARKAIKAGWRRLYLIESFSFRQCEAVKQNRPKAGRRCRRHALHGKRFCLMHERTEHAADHAQAMREALAR